MKLPGRPMVVVLFALTAWSLAGCVQPSPVIAIAEVEHRWEGDLLRVTVDVVNTHESWIPGDRNGPSPIVRFEMEARADDEVYEEDIYVRIEPETNLGTDNEFFDRDGTGRRLDRWSPWGLGPLPMEPGVRVQLHFLFLPPDAFTPEKDVEYRYTIQADGTRPDDGTWKNESDFHKSGWFRP